MKKKLIYSLFFALTTLLSFNAFAHCGDAEKHAEDSKTEEKEKDS